MILDKLRTFRGLGRRGRCLAVESLLLPSLIRLGFHLVGVTRTSSLLELWSRSARNIDPAEPGVLIQESVRIQRIVRNSTGLCGTCLTRSLALQAILRKRGVLTDLRVGVRKESGLMEGHAWLEYQDLPINESRVLVATYVLFDAASQFSAWRSLR